MNFFFFFNIILIYIYNIKYFNLQIKLKVITSSGNLFFSLNIKAIDKSWSTKYFS